MSDIATSGQEAGVTASTLKPPARPKGLDPDRDDNGSGMFNSTPFGSDKETKTHVQPARPYNPHTPQEAEAGEPRWSSDYPESSRPFYVKEYGTPNNTEDE